MVDDDRSCFLVNGINYRIIDKKNRKVEVAFSNSPLVQKKLYAGKIKIPGFISIDGKEYSVTEIGEKAFCFSMELTSVSIPDTLVTIGARAFWGCHRLNKIVLSASVERINPDALSFCLDLKNIEVEDGNRFFSSHEGILYNAAKTAVLFCPCGKTSAVIIPTTAKRIEDRSFLGCAIDSVCIPDTVTSIGNEAFSHCKNLTSLYIPNSVTAIGKGAFYDSALKSVRLPEHITYIDNYTFHGCKLESVNIPNSVKSIGVEAFSNCMSLHSLNIPCSVTSIGQRAFMGCHLKSLIIPGSVTNIGRQAFCWYSIGAQIKRCPFPDSPIPKNGSCNLCLKNE